jgi:septum formation protein
MEPDGMHDPPILLASASPRRRRLLEWLGVGFEVAETDTPEDLGSALASLPPILARAIAAEKASAARAETGANHTIVACDTIVTIDREILGKPADVEEGLRMLRALSGRTHSVITGVAIQAPDWDQPRTFAVSTPVRMNELTDEELDAWTSRGEFLGCAGAYNIEHHLGSVAPDECFQNVAGLPLCHLYHELCRAGHTGLTCPVDACDAARNTRCGLGPSVAGRAIPPGR